MFTLRRSAKHTLGRRSKSAAAPVQVVSAVPAPSAASVDFSFSDGNAYRFHNAWLRDACRDESHIGASSERVLDASPLVARLPFDMSVKDVSVQNGGKEVQVEWGTGDVASSTFTAPFLRTYGEMAGKVISGAEEASEPADFFAPIASEHLGTGKTVSWPKDSLQLWSNTQADGGCPLPKYTYDEVARDPEGFLRSVLDPGGAIVTGMPKDDGNSGKSLSDFVWKYFGGLQKHPVRDNAHWVISTEKSESNKGSYSNLKDEDVRASANSYNTDQQLANHTDQSNYGTPGLLLMFHCAMGEGNNSLTDGFAVAYAMQERYPEMFELLATHGMNAGRRNELYREPFMSNTQIPVIQRAADGNISRIQYHEIYRTPLTLDYDTFPKYFAALDKFYEMVHSDEFKCGVRLHAGELLVMNNWRTMHGRAGLKGKSRTIIGGTVTRDAFYSALRVHRQNKLRLDPRDECGLRAADYETYYGYAQAA